MPQNTEQEEQNEDDTYTTKTNTRVRYLASILSTIITLAWLGLIYTTTLGITNLNNLGAGAFTATILIVLTAVGWVFGADLVEKYLGK